MSPIVWHPGMNQAEHVLWQLQNRDIHDPDFRYFKSFSGRQGLFVDVGANRGQSSVSVRMVCDWWQSLQETSRGTLVLLVTGGLVSCLEKPFIADATLPRGLPLLP